MGGREVGGLANMLAAHMDYREEHIKTVAKFWHAENMAQHVGLKAIDLFDEVATGNIKAIWIMGTNPAVSMPNANKVKTALENCDMVIVSDCNAETDTTDTANILLPAMGWAEKSGTVTNSERRISRQRGLLKAAGEAQPDWWIVSQVAQKMGFTHGFNYQSPRDVFVEHAALSAFENNTESKRLFNIGALSQLTNEEYDQLKPIQWPVTADTPNGTERLFTDNQFNTPSGKAQFISITAELPIGQLNKQYPLALNTGRIRDQWHTMTRTARSPRLLEHSDHPFASINPNTAKQYDLQHGDLVTVTTNVGTIQVIAELSLGMEPGQVFIPLHWNNQFASNARVDSLVAPITDPISGQPEFKHTPARLSKVTVTAWATIVSRLPINLDGFLYWHKSPLKQGVGYVSQVATNMAFDWHEFISAHSTDNNIAPLTFEHFSNPALLDERFICYTEDTVELAIYSHSNKEQLPKISWLQTLFEKSLMASSYSALLTGEDYQQCNSGKMICSCFKVSQERIINAIEMGASNSIELGEQLKCGTNCGSCVPELNTLVKTHQKQRTETAAA
jgi:assimilatory nitrate reductase catalytic subunit